MIQSSDMKASEWIREIQKQIELHGDLELRIGSMESMPEDFRGIEKWEKDRGGSDAPYFVLV